MHSTPARESSLFPTASENDRPVASRFKIARIIRMPRCVLIVAFTTFRVAHSELINTRPLLRAGGENC